MIPDKSIRPLYYSRLGINDFSMYYILSNTIQSSDFKIVVSLKLIMQAK